MTEKLNLRDIQGNILRAYGRFGFPFARYFLFHIGDDVAGRDFIDQVRTKVTTAERWQGGPDDDRQAGVPRPRVTLNIGFSWAGLKALDLPTRTLAQMPKEFIDGMARRADILGDTGASARAHWDVVWRRGAESADDAVHIWISMNAQMQADATPVPELDRETAWLLDLAARFGRGLRLLSGHGPEEADFQAAGASFTTLPGGGKVPSSKEHFGFADGIGDPVFEGQFAPEAEARRVRGRGKLGKDQVWRPLATGEFLLGHVDESQELPITTQPFEFTLNGSFMAYRKLHENVAGFRETLARHARFYARIMEVPEEEAGETLRAKMVGRWANGVPLMAAPTYREMRRLESDWADVPALIAKGAGRSAAEDARLQAYKTLLIDFRYRDDQTGIICPMGAHIRRGNVRDTLDPMISSRRPKDWDGTALANRRRILRRGLPYGSFDADRSGDDQEHGVIFLAVCADLERQFEFVLQQWINYGMDLNLGNDTCPLLGLHGPAAKFVIAADPASGKPPFIMDRLPQFVTTRGGEYFFIPGINALRMIATGTVDPT